MAAARDNPGRASKNQNTCSETARSTADCSVNGPSLWYAPHADIHTIASSAVETPRAPKRTVIQRRKGIGSRKEAGSRYSGVKFRVNKIKLTRIKPAMIRTGARKR